jgi:hypothetical protein
MGSQKTARSRSCMGGNERSSSSRHPKGMQSNHEELGTFSHHFMKTLANLTGWHTQTLWKAAFLWIDQFLINYTLTNNKDTTTPWRNNQCSNSSPLALIKLAIFTGRESSQRSYIRDCLGPPLREIRFRVARLFNRNLTNMNKMDNIL